MSANHSLQKLLDELGRLPGIGPKSAQRIAYYLLEADAEEARRLAEAILEVKQEVHFCSRCFNYATADECSICQDPMRDTTRICVVGEPRDVQAIERTGSYHGLYHVLGGVISPMDKIGPEQLHIRELRYKSSNGTDFTVGMIPEAQFCGGGETSLQGIFFNPNIPTEECFISPMRGVAEGIVYATKPLSYQGQLISGFWIRFHEGKAVEWHAEENNELLTKLIEMDEGSRYLGECALVPFDSPINQTGLLFYNTLFDENACCHLALGMGFADTIKDFQNKTLDECRKLGVNDSMIHEDFMIGSADLSIDAVCEDGKTVAIFRNGTWAF